jgi:carbon-monoxide dehydrogenase medium subunit
MKPAPFRFHAPTSVNEALALLAEFGPDDGRVLAGGQSLVPTMAFRMARPAHLIDINRIEELRKIAVERSIIRIGACVRHAAFETDVISGQTGALLRKIVRHIAHHPIRTRGTFCGSVANADPASEWCCVLAALDGVVIARNVQTIRRIAAADCFQGVMTTALREDELLYAVELPVLGDDTVSGFAEFGRRPGDFAISMVLATYRLENGVIAEPRLAVGGAETHPRRIAEAEDALHGRAPGAPVFEEAAAIAAAAIEPMEDNNNTAAFRRGLVRTLAQRALESAA